MICNVFDSNKVVGAGVVGAEAVGTKVSGEGGGGLGAKCVFRRGRSVVKGPKL